MNIIFKFILRIELKRCYVNLSFTTKLLISPFVLNWLLVTQYYSQKKPYNYYIRYYEEGYTLNKYQKYKVSITLINY